MSAVVEDVLDILVSNAIENPVDVEAYFELEGERFSTLAVS
jgi:hypothetical protein